MIEQVVRAAGIMVGDASGNMNLDKTVTRAEYAKMLVAASTYKDKVSGVSNSSPFSDVPYTHWAAGYIKTAVAQGWLTGYLDGSYKPDNTVTLEEAATGALKLLGYTTEDFSGLLSVWPACAVRVARSGYQGHRLAGHGDDPPQHDVPVL